MYIMPTIRELKAKIKKYKDENCTGISRMKKANLIIMADKLGLNPTSDDVKSLRKIIKDHQLKHCFAYSKLTKPALIKLVRKLGLDGGPVEAKQDDVKQHVSSETAEEKDRRRRVLGSIIDDEAAHIAKKTAHVYWKYSKPIKPKLKKKLKKKPIKRLTASDKKFTSSEQMLDYPDVKRLTASGTKFTSSEQMLDRLLNLEGEYTLPPKFQRMQQVDPPVKRSYTSSIDTLRQDMPYKVKTRGKWKKPLQTDHLLLVDVPELEPFDRDEKDMKRIISHFHGKVSVSQRKKIKYILSQLNKHDVRVVFMPTLFERPKSEMNSYIKQIEQSIERHKQNVRDQKDNLQARRIKAESDQKLRFDVNPMNRLDVPDHKFTSSEPLLESSINRIRPAKAPSKEFRSDITLPFRSNIHYDKILQHFKGNTLTYSQQTKILYILKHLKPEQKAMFSQRLIRLPKKDITKYLNQIRQLQIQHLEDRLRDDEETLEGFQIDKRLKPHSKIKGRELYKNVQGVSTANLTKNDKKLYRARIASLDKAYKMIIKNILQQLTPGDRIKFKQRIGKRSVLQVKKYLNDIK